ncbi:MAG: methane monooxygenase/ammonia monooxygenase subunit B, partial [Deltaproteobacteria bacterium]|nr:methane monooxygenase/ammonia monooxygenase subunit B [Deltaproteobacteria bacterium]
IMTMRRLVGLVIVLWALSYAPRAETHGEKSQEPFLRLRTIMWYDVQWSTDRIRVGEEMTITGKFHLFEEWPVRVVPPPSEAWVNVSVPGPQLLRKATYLNGVPLVSTVGLELGRDYEFKLVLQGRRPGSYHLHPMVNVQGGGPIVGPGQWVTVEGDASSFSNPVTTLTGETIDLETYGLGRVVGWHLMTIVLAIAWLGFWLVPRPFLGRLLLVEKGAEDELISDRDRRVGWAFLIVAVLLVVGGYYTTNAVYPVTVPLQSARVTVPPLEQPPRLVEATVERATYAVTTRTFTMDVRVTNKGNQPVRLGELTTANIRFLNPALFPTAEHRLVVEPADPINPGETKTIRAIAADAVWETERLTMAYDPENRFAALLMFFDTEGGRRIIAVSGGPVIPKYRGT